MTLLSHPEYGMRRVTIALLAMTAAAAQAVLDDPKKIADAQKMLDTFRGERVRCEVQPGIPRLSFSLRLQSGYFWNLHLSESKVAGQKWIVLARVTPKGGSRSPVFLSDVVQFPNSGAIDWEKRASHFWVGEGRYNVKFLMFDESGRACRQEWQIEARLSSAERKIHPLLAPNSVASVSWNVAVRPTAIKPVALTRVTILLDVADQIGTSDQIRLLDALTALIDELPVKSVRLVLFDLTQQKEVFRRDDFTSEALPEVAKAMRAVQFEPVNVNVLQNPAGGTDTIENLASQEIHSTEPPDAVVFLGIPSFYRSKPSAYFGQPAGAKPQFFYLLCPASLAPGAYGSGRAVGFGHRAPVGPDSIEYAVGKLGGKTLWVDTPESFAKAVGEITGFFSASK
jgi:hypothetical protein